MQVTIAFQRFRFPLTIPEVDAMGSKLRCAGRISADLVSETSESRLLRKRTSGILVVYRLEFGKGLREATFVTSWSLC